MLIRGDRLDYGQRQIVLAAFLMRWTHENAMRTYGGSCPACVQSGGNRRVGNPNVEGAATWHEYHRPLTTDDEWLRTHAFHFTKDGRRLMANKRFAEPAYMAGGN
jgi:hypothetical protein